VDVDEEDRLSYKKIDDLKNLYSPLIDHLLILDYQSARYRSFKKESGDTLKEEEEGELNSESIKHVIKRVCEYILPSTKS